MKRRLRCFYFSIIALLAGVFILPVNAQDMIITGVLDGPLSGGTPKCVEVYVLNDIPDLDLYGLGSANNGNGSDGEEFTFPAGSATAGTFIYLASESTEFNNFFGFAPDHTTSAANVNGDDAIELFYNSSVVDIFGDINVDGSGEPWEYLDGWAYRQNATGPNGTEFQLTHWDYSGPNALDDETTNAGAATPFPIGTYSTTDDVAPDFTPGYPKADDIQTEQFDIVMNLDEPGNVYYLVLANEAPAPTRAEVMAGDVMNVIMDGEDYSTTISSLTPETEYDVYFLAEDDEAVPNIQDTTTLLEVTTLTPKAIELTYPVGGETFYSGDTIDMTWNSTAIDSILVFYWIEIPGFGGLFASFDGQEGFDAAPGTGEFILNPAFSVDSTRFVIQDWELEEISDTSGWFYITDTISPGIMALQPENKSNTVLRSDTLGIGFTEFMDIDTGSVRIYNEDGTLFDSIPVPSDQVSNMLDAMFGFTPNKLFENDSSYYVLMDSATFYDKAGNAFRGITEDTTWTFTVKDPRKLDLTYPAGGETFFVGDTVIIKWTSEGIDSLQLWARNFADGEDEEWFPVLGKPDTKVWAGQDSIVLPIPPSAGLDSTYFRLTVADDFNFFDSCGIFYLADTLEPLIGELYPANHDSGAALYPILMLAMNEMIFTGTGNITIKKKADDSVHETIPVDSDSIEINYNEVLIKLSTELMRGTEYYILIDSGAFIDFQDNAFAGISSDTAWTFITIGADLLITEYIEGGSSRKALELYNPTDETISLDSYRIAQSANGDGWEYWHYFPGGSTLAPGDFYILITNDVSFTDTTYFDPADADEILSSGGSAVSFNGNDARAIEKQIDGEWFIIDIFGDPDDDQNYDVAGISGAAKDHTIRRKDFINYGNDKWPLSAGTNAFDSEWKVLEKDNFENLGMLTPPSDTLAEIDSFSLAQQTLPAVIDSAAATVTVEVALGTKLDSLFPYIEVSPNAFVEPASGDSVDFSGGPVEFVVTAEDRQHVKVWTVTVTEKTEPSSENDITSFSLAEQTGAATIDAVNHIVNVVVEYGTSLTALVPTIAVSGGATIDPLSGVEQDFTSPVTYTVTAEDGTTQEWTVTVNVVVGINPVMVNNLFEVYPNPSNGIFTLHLDADAGTEFEVTITNLSGQVMMKRTFNVFDELTESLDLTNYGAGVYLMRVRTSDQIQLEKLIIE